MSADGGRIYSKRLIEVACALIEDDGKVLVARRPESTDQPLKWELPGGKLKVREKPEQCIVREIREELGLEITVLFPLPHTTHRYENKSVRLYPFICHLKGGELTLKEHVEAVWCDISELLFMDWSAADIPIVEKYLQTRCPEFF